MEEFGRVDLTQRDIPQEDISIEISFFCHAFYLSLKSCMAQSNVPKISKQAAANIIKGKKGCHVLLNKDVTFAGRRRKQSRNITTQQDS